MGTSDVLRSSIRSSHGEMGERLGAAREMGAPPGRPRAGHERIDVFLAMTSKHLHAVDAVLVPRARKQVPEGGALVHDYLRSTKDLEVVLAHVKAHEYGSVYETSFSWPEVWADVDVAMTDHQRHEAVLGDRLSETLDDPDLEELARRLRDVELGAPSRPHPYVPHTGMLGLVARKVMHTADRFWDVVENRMVPEPQPEPKKTPGRVAQYFLADPRFDEEDPQLHS